MLLNCADLSEKKGMKLDNSVRGSPGLCGGGLWWWCLRIELDTRVFSLRFFILFFTPLGLLRGFIRVGHRRILGEYSTSSVPGVVPV